MEKIDGKNRRQSITWILLTLIFLVGLFKVLYFRFRDSCQDHFKITWTLPSDTTIVATVLASYEVKPLKVEEFSIKKGSRVKYVNKKSFYRKGESIIILENDALSGELYQKTLNLRQKELEFRVAIKKFMTGFLDYESYLRDSFAVLRAKEDLKQLELKIKNCSIKAPFDGYVTLDGIFVGKSFSKDTLLEFYSKDIKISGYIRDFEFLRTKELLMKLKKLSVNIITPFNLKLKTRILSMNMKPEDKKDVVYYIVEMIPEGNSKRLIPYLKGDLSILLEKKCKICIPIESIVGSDTSYVYVVKNGEVFKKRVNIGFVGDLFAEILEGLSLKDTVVTGPVSILRNLEDTLNVIY